MFISFWDFEVLATTWGHLSRLIPRGQKKTEHVPQILVGAGGKSQWWSPYPGFWGPSPQKTWFTEDEQWARHEWRVRPLTMVKKTVQSQTIIYLYMSRHVLELPLLWCLIFKYKICVFWHTKMKHGLVLWMAFPLSPGDVWGFLGEGPADH